MSYFLQQVLNGLTLSAIYGLVGMINVADRDLYMIGAFVSLNTYFALGAVRVTRVPLALGLAWLSSIAAISSGTARLRCREPIARRSTMPKFAQPISEPGPDIRWLG